MVSEVSDLAENQMIQEAKSLMPAWIFFFAILLFTVLVWEGVSWSWRKWDQIRTSNPLTQVTNRDFSLFLWQFPEYMRASVSMKVGYLDGFHYKDKVSIEPGMADKYAVVPPHVLFFYHIWKELFGSYRSGRSINSGEFLEFLEYCPEWKPDHWPDAPQGYREIVKLLGEENISNALPLKVNQAVIGWKNFFYDQDQINEVKPTYEQMKAFLREFPNYAEKNWRKLAIKNKPNYLKTLFSGTFDPKEAIPEDELVPHLKVGYYNNAVDSTKP